MPAVKSSGVRRSVLRGQQRSRGVVVSQRVRVSRMQRARLLAAATVSIAELGYARASVAHITARARVSRRTFYDLFASREECLIAVMQGALEQVGSEIAVLELAGLGWRERVRSGLFVILSFLDREPLLARVCVVQALQGAPRVLAWREENILERLIEIWIRVVGRARGRGYARSLPRRVSSGRRSRSCMRGSCLRASLRSRCAAC